MTPRTKIQFEGIRQEKRNLILNSSLKLFAKNGYHGTSISMIAKKAGISKGLMYSYFSSKESLLLELIQGYIELVSGFLNPDNDEEITNEEMEKFFILLKESLIKNNDYWQLITQITVQPQAMGVLMGKIKSGEILYKHEQLLKRYFEERFENPEVELFIFTSIIKGFSIQYSLAPELMSEKSVDDFILRMKKLYIKEKL